MKPRRALAIGVFNIKVVGATPTSAPIFDDKIVYKNI